MCPDGPNGTEVNVVQPTDDGGHARLRAEIPAKRRDNDASGDEKEHDKKIFDDVFDGLRGICSKWGPSLEAESDGEKATKAVDERRPDLQMDVIKKLPEREQVALIMTRMEEVSKQLERSPKRGATVVSRDPFGNIIKKT